MTRRHSWGAMFAIVSLLVLGFSLSRSDGARAQGQFPIMDKIAAKVIQKYTSSTCEELWIKKANPTPPTMEEQRAIGLLKSDPQMRAAFIAQIAPPIANKMFDCGMIP
jgi:hypothetical protein